MRYSAFLTVAALALVHRKKMHDRTFTSLRRLILGFFVLYAAHLHGQTLPPPTKRTQAAVAPSISASRHPAIGLNKFDLFRQYLGGITGEGNVDLAFQKVSQAMARKAMVDARNIGVTYLRVGVTGIAPRTYDSPGELDLWMHDSPRYWALVDQAMADLESNKLQIVPTFVWQLGQFASMTREKSSDMIKNPNSKSYKLLEKYVTEFVERYKSRPLVYFYELTNELNLAADIDEEKRCRESSLSNANACGPVGNISTADMVSFTRRLAGHIRNLDNSRLISSGFAIPRGNAEHLRQTPEFVNPRTRKPDDSVAEFKKNLRDIHEGLDIVSVHLYNQRDNERFGVKGHQSAGLLAIIKQATDEMGKFLFVGEFADKNPTVSEDPTAPYTQAVLRTIAELKIPFSAPWCWEFYHRMPKPGDMGREDTSLEPGLTDLVISKIVAANKTLGNPGPSAETPDRAKPIVIIYYPLQGAKLSLPEQPVYVVASSAIGISKVALLLDGKVIASVTAAPYKFVLRTDNLAEGSHEVIARAYDQAGNISDHSVSLLRGPGPLNSSTRSSATLASDSSRLTAYFIDQSFAKVE